MITTTSLYFSRGVDGSRPDLGLPSSRQLTEHSQDKNIGFIHIAEKMMDLGQPLCL
jgi:hypothetical protein